MYNKKVNQMKNCYSVSLVSVHAHYHTVTNVRCCPPCGGHLSF